MTLGELRVLIREVLKERAVMPSQANHERLALMKDRDQLVLYDVAYYVNLVKQVLDDPKKRTPSQVRKALGKVLSDPGGIYAYVSITQPQPTYAGAWKIEFSAARPGYGPLMYDIAMAAVPGGKGLMPDRVSVSDAARKVWKYYYNHRPDVTKKPIPPTAKAYRHDEADSPELDMIYKATKVPGYGALVNRNLTFVHVTFNELLRRAGASDFVKEGITADDIEQYLVHAAGFFFNKSYAAGHAS